MSKLFHGVEGFLKSEEGKSLRSIAEAPRTGKQYALVCVKEAAVKRLAELPSTSLPENDCKVWIGPKGNGQPSNKAEREAKETINRKRKGMRSGRVSVGGDERLALVCFAPIQQGKLKVVAK